MDLCNQIPLYTPVATFYNGRYSSSGGVSGVFLGCLQNGFKVSKVSINPFKPIDFTTLINGPVHFGFKVMGSIFHFYLNFNRTFCKQ